MCISIVVFSLVYSVHFVLPLFSIYNSYISTSITSKKIHKEYPDAVYCQVKVGALPREPEYPLLCLNMYLKVVFSEVPLQLQEDDVIDEQFLTHQVIEELETEDMSDNIEWSLSSSIFTIKQWNKKVREGLRWDLDSAVSLCYHYHLYLICSI